MLARHHRSLLMKLWWARLFVGERYRGRCQVQEMCICTPELINHRDGAAFFQPAPLTQQGGETTLWGAVTVVLTALLTTPAKKTVGRCLLSSSRILTANFRLTLFASFPF